MVFILLGTVPKARWPFRMHKVSTLKLAIFSFFLSNFDRIFGGLLGLWLR